MEILNRREKTICPACHADCWSLSLYCTNCGTFLRVAATRDMRLLQAIESQVLCSDSKHSVIDARKGVNFCHMCGSNYGKMGIRNYGRV
ncbi:MAG TPA: hypothetical protein VEA59_01925 [Patescibacteria group bacterium]|nr:hypothetical protein [Patescibacteria group bacterium]